MHKYKDVYELLENDAKAKDEFEKLPDYVKESIKERPDGVSSYESLQGYIDKLTRGDN